MSSAIVNRFMKRLCSEINEHPDENAVSHIICTFENYIRRRLRPSVYFFLFLIFLSLIFQAATLFYVFRLREGGGGGAARMISQIA